MSTPFESPTEAWALADVAAGIVAAPNIAPDLNQCKIEAARVVEAVGFATEGARMLAAVRGLRNPLSPDAQSAPEDWIGRWFETASGLDEPVTPCEAAIAWFGRYYALHHPALAVLARLPGEQYALDALARLGASIATAARDPSEEPLAVAEFARRADEIARAHARVARRSRILASFEREVGPVLQETLLQILAGLAPAHPVVLATRVEEGIRALEDSMAGRSAIETEPARDALESLLAENPAAIPDPLRARAGAAIAAELHRAGREREACETLAALAQASSGRELDLAASHFESLAGIPPTEWKERVEPGERFRRLLERKRQISAPACPGLPDWAAPGTQHRAVIEEVGEDRWTISIPGPDGASLTTFLEPEDWRWPDGARDRIPHGRPGYSIIVEIVPPRESGRAKVVTVDPWDRYLPRFVRSHQDRVFRGRVVEVEDERLIVCVIERLVGEPDGVLGELPADAIDLVVPLPLGLFFEKGEDLPVLVSEVDAEEGWLSFTSPWIDRDPWQEGYVARSYRPGVVYRGTVVRLEPSAVGVLLEPGIVGTMPPSTRGRYGLGVPVEVLVTGVDEDRREIRLERKL